METADVERRISAFEERNAKLPDNRLSARSEKSYTRASPPVRYVDLGRDKSTEHDVLKKDPASITSYNPSHKLAHSDKRSEAKSRDNVVPSCRDVVFLNSAEQSSLISKDFNAAECISILATPAECVVSSCVIQDQKKAASASISCSLMNFLSGDHLNYTPLGVEKGPMEIDADFDDVDDRPLVLDLGDAADTYPPLEPSASPAVIFSEEGPTVFRRPFPPPKASLKAAHKISSAGLSSNTHVPPPSTRVQKPIRPFIPQHFNSLECNSVCNLPTSIPAHHLPAPPIGPATLCLQSLSPQLPPSVPSVVGPQQTNGVQFMSILTPPQSVATAPSASPVHLFNLTPMSGYFNAASSVFFQSIPSAGGGRSVPSGSIQFAPPPLFASQAFPPPPPTFASHFARAPSNLTLANSHAPHTEGNLPPPPPLAPAPTLTSMQQQQQHAGATRSQQLAGLFIPDMSAWTIPTLQPVFSSQHASITAATISGGEVVYSTVLAPTAPATANSAFVVPSSSPSVSSRSTSLPSTTPSLPLTTSLNSNAVTPTTVNGGTMTSIGNFTISARRWRPSFGRKNGATISTCPLTISVDETPTTGPSSYTTTLTTAVSTSFSGGILTSPSVTVVEELPPRAENSTHVRQRKRSHEKSAPKRRKVNATSAKPRTSDFLSPLRLIKMEERKEVSNTRSEVEVDVPSPSPALLARSRANSFGRPIQSPSYASLVTQSTMERKIISHFIDGHVLYESNLPFPVRNAMSIVRATLQSNGDTKSYDIASAAVKSTCIDRNRQVDSINKATNGERSLAVAATTRSLPPPPLPTASTTYRQHSVSLSSPSGHQKRQQVKPCVLNSRVAKSHKETGIGDGTVGKKPRKKSLPVHRAPYVADNDAVIPVSAQNGHKVVFGISISPTNSKLAVSTLMMSKPMISTTDCAAAAAASPPPPPPSTTAAVATTEAIPTASASSSISGGGGNDLKVKIHPVYQDGTCTAQAASTPPTPTSTLCTKFSPSIVIAASTSSSSLSVVSDSPSVVSSVSPSSVTSAVLRTHCAVVTKASTVAASAHATSVCSSRVGNYVLPRQLPPPLPRGPIKSWSPSAVADFVRGTPNCANYAVAFEENEIDGEALLLLTTTHFVEPPIGMKIGHALKFAHRIQQVLDPTPDTFDSIKAIDESVSGTTE